ncbi:MAG: S-adenosylmethionine--2-demethylmenaquinone methyltransferase [Candidatus Eremiobacteraeota bacterium]|jgi:regulator of ribonuclease activity A|nr:S-adenosylmethionine--2-demethylmenaquinone methyltransferase [Candidatus Eremiobacteraeota bacterium]
MSWSTADLVDAHQERLQSCEAPLRQFGGRAAFHGAIRTVSTFCDNALIREVLLTNGDGRVLVVDGGGSLHAALVGDMIAGLALANGWSGLVIFGAVRDVVALRALDVGIKALGSNPMKSAKRGIGAVDVPLSFGGVLFRPGAWLYSDDDGILVSDAALV